MEFVFFGDYVPGIRANDRVYDISALVEGASPLAIVRSFIERAEGLRGRIDALIAGGGGVPVADVRLRAPVPESDQLLCAARNYRDYERERRGENNAPPDFFLKARGSVIGPGDTIVLPAHQAKEFHAEPELAVVIGTRADNVPAAGAMRYVFGYTAFIDFSARGLSSGFYIHKSFATFGPMGPGLVTADMVPNPMDLRIRQWVNGNLKHDFRTTEMANSIEKLIEAASAVVPLEPGDVIATGTHHEGLGPIMDGDKLTIEIEQVGSFSVDVRDAQHRTWERDVAVPHAERV